MWGKTVPVTTTFKNAQNSFKNLGKPIRRNRFLTLSQTHHTITSYATKCNNDNDKASVQQDENLQL